MLAPSSCSGAAHCLFCILVVEGFVTLSFPILMAGLREASFRLGSKEL